MTERLIGLLVALTPREFRVRNGDELLAVHGRRRARLSGPLAHTVFTISELLGVTLLLVRLHLGLSGGSY